jgi:DNA (cytosine-5)-methyltransferase 1
VGGFRLGLEKANLSTKQFRTQSGRWSFNKKEVFDRCGAMSSGIIKSRPNELRYRCVWANDFDKYACQIYRKNFGGKELVEGDIRSINVNSIPDHTLLTAGFPCQSFSVAGKRLGFQDTRGTLFHEILRVAEAKRPPLLLLENVRGLLSHDEGLTFQIILESLEELGYWCEWQVLNSKHYGVPQNRQRVFIIGHLGDNGGREVFPILGSDGGNYQSSEVSASIQSSYKKGVNNQNQLVAQGVTLANTSRYNQGVNRTPLKQDDQSFALNSAGDQGVTIIADRTRTLAGKGRNLESPKKTTNALSRVQKDNYLILSHSPRTNDPKLGGAVPLLSEDHAFTIDSTPHKVIKDMRIRRLTPRECERLQGFPDDWTQGVSDTQRYKCLGNAVTVNVIEFLGRRLMEREWSASKEINEKQ